MTEFNTSFDFKGMHEPYHYPLGLSVNRDYFKDHD